MIHLFRAVSKPLLKTTILIPLFFAHQIVAQTVEDQFTGARSCIDSDGDGWGWDGEKTCLIDSTTPTASTACIDSDGDGWGWDGEKTCETGDAPVESPTACIDSDGDGWGWDGEKTCEINGTRLVATVAITACIDSDGDGWGWDGEKPCQIDSAPVTTTACIDSNADGWGWDGVNTCIPGQQSTAVIPVNNSVTSNVFVSSVDEFDLRWGGYPLIADNSNKRLFLSLGEEFAARSAMSAPLEYSHADSGYLMTINGQQISGDSKPKCVNAHDGYR